MMDNPVDTSSAIDALKLVQSDQTGIVIITVVAIAALLYSSRNSLLKFEKVTTAHDENWAKQASEFSSMIQSRDDAFVRSMKEVSDDLKALSLQVKTNGELARALLGIRRE